MNIKIAVVDNDRNYLERLFAILQQYNELTISIYTKADTFREAMDSNNFQIVLFNPDVSDEQLVFPSKTMSICLWSDDCTNITWYPSFPKVQKYQRISNIYKEVIKNYAQYAKDNGTDFLGETGCSVIAVYSPVGGSGKTTIALSLAKLISKKKKRVLFLSVEQFNSSSFYYEIKEEGITKLVETLNEGTNFILNLKGILKQTEEGIFYIEGFSRLVDYEDVNQEEITEVIQRIKQSGVCDYIVIDTGSFLDSVNKTVLTKADKIVLVQRSGELADIKMNMFIEQVWFDELKSRSVVVQNFITNGMKYSVVPGIRVVGTVHGYGNIAHRDLLNYMEQENGIDISYVM